MTGQNVIVGQEKEMSTVYGAEHLLRMLGASSPYPSTVRGQPDTDVYIFGEVGMPAMVATSTMDPESVALVRDYVNELMA